MVSLSYLLGRTPAAAASAKKRSIKEKRDTDIYVSTSGSDSNPGTLASPLLTIPAAITKANAGDTIYLRGGTYFPSSTIQFSKSGTSSARYTISNYNNEHVIIDGENLPYTPGALDSTIPENNRGIFRVTGSYWTFVGLELIHGPYGIFARGASNNIYNRLVTRDNYETGLHLQGASSNNQIINVDSYGNRDPRKNGESADGIGIKEGSGSGNVIRGTRMWNNVDDGLDFWKFESPVTVENTYAWGNGFNRWGFTPFEGDGNGFKLGGGGTASVAHVVKNSVAFLNAKHGYTDNSQKGNMVITSNTAFNNQNDGFFFKSSSATLTKNIAGVNRVNQASLSGVTHSGNSWNSGGTWSNSSFASVSSSTLTGARASNGSIVATNFLTPTASAPSTTIGARIWGIGPL
ncbi:hypothetical protein ONZ45_g14651 [Pleurotus djamor]|nr:hypothetical protein ONZ45_g14651 [Pleurotus djamor]